MNSNVTKPAISVIIPVYNVEPYLRKCIDSVLDQSFTDFELLLVDDGSIDGSGMICDEYTDLDTRIKVFHTLNRGVSAARNLGMKYAQAPWVCFVDSDDWVDTNYLSAFMDDSLNENTLLVQKVLVDKENKKGKSVNLCTVLDVDYKNKYSFYVALLIPGSSPVAKLYNVQLIKKYQIYFDEKLSIAEDVLFLWTYLFYVKEVRLISSAAYHYIQRNNDSLVRRFHSSEEWIYLSKSLYERLKVLLQCGFLKNIPDERLRCIVFHRILVPLFKACKNMNHKNYVTILTDVRAQKKLIDKYYVPTIWWGIHKYFIFCRFLSDKSLLWVFIWIRFAGILRKRIKNLVLL
ncbi:glycosyltransferase family 2 protein [Bacteroides sp. An279]|uniref:glycosyltransferase family 2 protein n=1 Tax=Bacteroides sp. An279 TaxID=1965620 RepID=UPI000B36A5C0|nr:MULTISPECIES: glycosyltransferase family 2 protein [Bacteroides]OUO61376.1 hypothetical protein B5F78_04810 [Bacteroides sp. An279]